MVSKTKQNSNHSLEFKSFIQIQLYVHKIRQERKYGGKNKACMIYKWEGRGAQISGDGVKNVLEDEGGGVVLKRIG